MTLSFERDLLATALVVTYHPEKDPERREYIINVVFHILSVMDETSSILAACKFLSHDIPASFPESAISLLDSDDFGYIAVNAGKHRLKKALRRIPTLSEIAFEAAWSRLDRETRLSILVKYAPTERRTLERLLILEGIRTHAGNLMSPTL